MEKEKEKFTENADIAEENIETKELEPLAAGMAEDIVTNEEVEEIAEELENIIEIVESAPMQKPKKKWKKLVLWSTFILIIIGVFVFTLLNDVLGDKPISFAGLGTYWWFLIIAAAATATFFVCRAIVFSVMMHLFTGKARFRLCMSITMIGFFYDNLTPFGAGGQPFQIHYMQDKGLPKGAAITLPVIEYVVSSFVFVFVSIVAIIMSATNVFGNYVEMNPATRTALYITASVGIVLNFGIPFLIIVSLFSKKACRKVTRFAVKIAALLKITRHPDRLYKRIMANLNANLNCMKIVIKKKRLILCFLFSFGETLAIASIGYFVIKAFGFGTPHGWGWAEIIVLSMLIRNSVAFIPTPGSSGAVELSFYLVFYEALAISTGAATGAMATLFWRILSFYIPALVGFIIIVTISSKKRRLKVMEKKEGHGKKA